MPNQERMEQPRETPPTVSRDTACRSRRRVLLRPQEMERTDRPSATREASRSSPRQLRGPRRAAPCPSPCRGSSPRLPPPRSRRGGRPRQQQRQLHSPSQDGERRWDRQGSAWLAPPFHKVVDGEAGENGDAEELRPRKLVVLPSHGRERGGGRSCLSCHCTSGLILPEA